MASLKVAKMLDKSTKVVFRGLKHNVETPPLACGTWSWGDTRQWGYEEKRDLPAIQGVWSALNKEKLGFYDGAEVYGPLENERILGRLIKDTPAEDKEGMIIATKWLPFPVFVGRLLPGRGIVGALRNSLARLGLEQVDLYQVHIPIFWFYSIETIADGLAECVNLGLTKTVGVSNFSIEQMIRMHDALAKHGVPLASNQIEFNLLRRLPETSGLLAACHERDIVPLAYSPIAQGRLTGKYTSKNPPPSNRNFGNQPWEIIDPLIEVMKQISEKRDVPISAVAINWVMCKGCVPLPGARNADQALQNAKSLGFRLTDEEIEQLDKLAVDGNSMRLVQAG
ncbi:hypothetical protein DRE_02974 [Drechslerella stenobrocha 248]|uniref:NADP-dependent oxidoreductase domain-containing protein n=1 Tax=Drechslerella stenobrocha 248 TaxID=1043628 RepID=W7HW68_9PEZI|nr:hypothetical protein DRE_02974 [Drechslerella stenobrocha 248]